MAPLDHIVLPELLREVPQEHLSWYGLVRERHHSVVLHMWPYLEAPYDIQIFEEPCVMASRQGIGSATEVLLRRKRQTRVSHMDA